MKAANRIVLKYGLKNLPDKAQLDKFSATVKIYIRQGKEAEEAGYLAARDIFPDYRSMFYKSEADTLEMLLRLIESE